MQKYPGDSAGLIRTNRIGVGLGWVGLGWAGLGWVGQGLVGVGKVLDYAVVVTSRTCEMVIQVKSSWRACLPCDA